MTTAAPYTGGVPEVTPDVRSPDNYQRASAATADAFGGSVAKGLEQAGAGALKAGHFFGQVAADDALNQYQDFTTKLLHGDPNKTTLGEDGQPQPDLGYMALKGRAALDKRPEVEAALDARLKEVRSGLLTPDQQAQFDTISRRYRADLRNRIGTHADNQANTWYSTVNQSTASLALRHISVNADNGEEVAKGAADLIAARVKEAQLKGGGPELVNEAVASAKRDALKAQLEAISVADPARAVRILEKNRDVAGEYYQPLASQFRTRAERQRGDTAGAGAIASSANRFTPVVADAIARAASANGLDPEVLRRFAIIESSGDPTNQTGSYKGLFQLSMDEFSKRGGKNIYDPFENANAAAQKLKDEARAFEAKYGRSATASDLYLIHQQGVGGYAAHLSNPNAPAWQNMLSTAEGRQKGEAWAKKAIWGNIPDTMKSRYGSVENVTSGDFTKMWAGIVNNGATAIIKADAYQKVLDNPDLNHEERSHALQFINQTMTAQQIANNENERAKKDANDEAANGFVTRMLNGKTGGMFDEIANNPSLTWQTKEHLTKMLEQQSGSDVEKSSRAYGPGFWGAYTAIMAPPDDPARIGDPADLYKRAGPNGDLTVAGVEKLTGTMRAIQKSLNDHSVNTTKLSLMKYAKSKLSFEVDEPGFRLRDPKGEAIFNAQFIPKFEAGFDQWLKAGKLPADYLNQENVDKMMTGMRPKSQMEMDKLRATGAAEGDKPQAIPPAPAGVDKKVWATVMEARPILDGKALIHPNAWAAAIGVLMKDPSPTNMALFGKAFPEVDVPTIIEKLGVPAKAPTQPQKAAPFEAAAPAAPPPLPTREDIEGYQSALQRMLSLPKESLDAIVGGLPDNTRDKLKTGKRTLSDMFFTAPTQ